MFPDLTSDDIFRIETKRLWLRWPRATDAAAIKAFAGLAEVAQMTAEIPHPYPAGEAERFILQARADNASGRGLVLAVTQKSAGRAVIGIVGAHADHTSDVEIGYAFAPAHWGKGIATEAVKGLIDTVFRVAAAERVLANSRVINPASCRVLEKCGLDYIDTGLDMLPARGGLHPCDRFSLDRKTWMKRLAPRSLPSMLQQTHGADIPLGDAEATAQ
jgi:RimJ/RimL family protein N-acetyltransferase